MARKSMNILDVVSWINANRDVLVGSRLDNFYREDGLFLVKVSSRSGDRILVLEPGVRLHFTRRLRPSGKYKPYPLIVLVRKYLRGSRIEDASILEFDRIVKFTFSNGFSIIAELIPRGFLVLVDGDGVIHAADRYDVLRDRVVKPKVHYKPPPLNTLNPLSLEPRVLLDRVKSGRDLVRGLIRGAGIPGEVAEEAVYRAGLEPGMDPSTLTTSDAMTIVDALRDIWSEAMGGRGYVVYRRGIPFEADPFKPLRFRDDVDIVDYDHLDDALDDFFYHRESRGEDVAEAEMERLLASVREAEETERRYREMAEELRRAASILAERFEWLEYVISCVKTRLSEGGNPLDCNGVVEVGKRGFKVSIDNAVIPIGIDEDASRVIVRLFREAGELEAKAKRASKAREQVMSKLEEVEVRAKARRLSVRVKARKRRWFERYHWIITSNGFLAIGGRDASQNESIVRRYLEDNDVFIHADIHGAPAVVLKTQGREPSLSDLIDAAVIAVAYSKAWKSGLGSTGAYWVWGSQVSKTPPSGEYLAKGGFIIRGKRNYLKPLRVSLTIGITLDEEKLPLVIVGPESLVRDRSLVYAVLEPGDMKLEETAKMLKSMFYKILPREDRHIPLAVPDEELILRIPGRSRIVRVAKGRGRELHLIEELE
ncbi:MAG: NFACT family protein [Desulfurococcales archaeon]|nr:NFACT family protein [Desulfurococcales archaeon]